MKMRRKSWFLLAIVGFSLLWFAGCSKEDTEKQWDANCHIYMDNLPEDMESCRKKCGKIQRFGYHLKM